MTSKILLQIGVHVLTGSFFVFATMAAAQSSSQAVPSAVAPGNAGSAPSSAGNSLELPAFPGTNAPAAAIPAAPAPAPRPAIIPPVAAPVPTPAAPPPVAVAPPPPAITRPAPVAAPAKNTAPSAASSPESDALLAKDPDLLLTPLHLGSMSLLFPQNDIDVIKQLLELYDNASNTQKQAVGHTAGDDLNSLLKELTSSNAPPPVQVMLPNVYLASIVYYSPSHWSVWINDKKLVNTRNTPDNEFYVSRISRTQAELVWKPTSLLDTGATWKERTDNGKKPLVDITVDESKGTITLLLRPGQTFLPRSLAIAEGLIKSVPAPAAPANP